FNYLLLDHLVENSYCIGYLNRLAIVEEENKNNSVSLLRYNYSWSIDGEIIGFIGSEKNKTLI
ncbi:MAG: hypothetical protein HOD90_00400, partial [Nitrospina sp.]|nr:hypothetical protein [Nitrospina sp.]